MITYTTNAVAQSIRITKLPVLTGVVVFPVALPIQNSWQYKTVKKADYHQASVRAD